MISNLNGSGSVQVRFRFTEKKRVLPVRGSGSGSVRLPAKNIKFRRNQSKSVDIDELSI